jgi:opacity protein-like surface antigen
MKNALLLGLLCWTSLADAGSMGQFVPQWRWVGSLSAGPAWENAGATQTFNLTPEIEKTYSANKSTNAVADVELFLGSQQGINPSLVGQLGLAVGVTSDAALSGRIWEDADPLFDNYTYDYNVQHTHVAAKGKLLADMGYWVMPWLSASIGVGFNHASGFNNTPLIEEAVVNPNFKSHTETAFTYTVGAGIQKALKEHWQVGVGYEFADWGRSQLGLATGQSINSGLKLNHLYTNGVLLNLTYVS